MSHLNGHIIVHSNLVPFQCDYCEKRCNRLDNFKKHMELHTKDKDFILFFYLSRDLFIFF